MSIVTAQKVLLAHAIMFGLEGVPAVYFPSLFSTENATHRVEATAHNRAINRPAWTEEGVNAHLEAESEAAQFLDDLKSLMAMRRRQPAFHPMQLSSRCTWGPCVCLLAAKQEPRAEYFLPS